MKERIEYIFVLLLIGFFRMLPFGLSVQLGSLLGASIYLFDRRHRLIALNNLRVSFKETKSERQLREILLGVYRNIGKTAIEAMLLPKMSPSEINEKTEIEGFEHYERAKAKNKGIILLGAHFGSWEWIPVAMGLQGASMHIIVRPVDNPYLNRLVQKLRERYGNVVLNKRTETGGIIKLLRSGKSIGFLLDQNVRLEKAVFTDFFGRPAATNKALATIALRTGAPVIPMFIIRTSQGHKIVIERPMDLPRTGILKQDLKTITRLFTKKIETYVRQYPTQWLWLHRRWKTQPPAPDEDTFPSHD